MGKAWTVGASAALAIVMAGAAVAHDMGQVPNTPGGRAAAARHENFKQLGAAFKEANDELKKPNPNKGLIAADANKVAALAPKAPSWFPKGSGPESKANTKAKPEVWTDAAGFAAAMQRMQGEAAKFQKVANAGDLDAIKQQARALGGACKNCHDKYRVPEE